MHYVDSLTARPSPSFFAVEATRMRIHRDITSGAHGRSHLFLCHVSSLLLKEEPQFSGTFPIMNVSVSTKNDKRTGNTCVRKGGEKIRERESMEKKAKRELRMTAPVIVPIEQYQ